MVRGKVRKVTQRPPKTQRGKQVHDGWDLLVVLGADFPKDGDGQPVHVVCHEAPPKPGTRVPLLYVSKTKQWILKPPPKPTAKA